jgi:hypothetical protein
VAEGTVDGLGLEGLEEVRAVATVKGDRVEVTITARVRHIFSSAVPGGPDTAEVAAHARADAVDRRI